MAEAKPTISKMALYGVMTGMLLTGSFNTLILKVQDETFSDCNYFTHPYLQGMFMFLGEFTCWAFLFAKRCIYRNQVTEENDAVPLSPGTQKAKEVKKKTKINPLWLAIPASCDFMGSSLMFIALTMVDASIYQMMRGIIVVITALLAVIFLGRKQYRHHIVSLIMIVVGVAEVGYVAIAYAKNHPDEDASSASGSEAFGIILLLISQCFTGIQFIVEEKILGDYYLDPFLIVGTEGMWGLVYYLGLLSVMQIKTCGYGDGTLSALCNFGYLENSAYAWQQIADKPIIIAQTAGSVLSIACFNSFGIATTKYASAAQRSTIDTSRTIVIWACSCLFLGEPFQPFSIIGFLLLATGTLLYNEILVLPVLGFDQWTAEAIAKRNKRDGKDDVDQAYTSLSPHAAYDSKRNERGLKKAADEMQRTQSQALLAEEENEYMVNTRDHSQN